MPVTNFFNAHGGAADMNLFADLNGPSQKAGGPIKGILKWAWRAA
jgi:hypothetical protein